ncbi:MAG: nitroreductase family protein [Chloroflexota bacterium]
MTDSIDKIIRERKTAKILKDDLTCQPLSESIATEIKRALGEITEVAGWAPFHKPAHRATHLDGDLTSLVPWRFYVLEKAACCELLAFIQRKASDEPDSIWSQKLGSSVPKMLAACGALIQVTWLPNPPEEGENISFDQANIEHVAAASSAVQNLLLAAQARGLHNYWSSGGALMRHSETYDLLGIPQNQELLGSIFLTHTDQTFDKNLVGSLREKRGDVSDWTRWVTLESN